MSLLTTLGRLRLIGILEGISFLLLLGVAMPLKYVWGDPSWVRVVGMAHGVLFLLYVGAAIQAHLEYSWRLRQTFWVVVASLLPFGPFVVESRMLRPLAAEAAGG
jgi:integral membrane protein